MSDVSSAQDAAVEAALGSLSLEAKVRLLSGQDVWTLPAMPEIGLASIVMSDGPVGVRGTTWGAEDPSIALPSPTALAATWDPALARQAGQLLGQEARRKGVHVLLAPTVNLHRSPLGGRHFECYSEDPLLTGEIGAGYVAGVQDQGVATTVKHFVANDFETERFTVSVEVSERVLRELYLAPFEAIIARAGAWGVMSAYNSVNGVSMTDNAELQRGVLKDEWGFDGAIVSDWLAARDTAGAANGGLDIAMPAMGNPWGDRLVAAVRDGQVPVEVIDEQVRRVLRLAARVGALAGAPESVPPASRPAVIDGAALARQVAARSFVLAANSVLPLNLAELSSVALIGALARDARVLGGGSATVFPAHIVSPLEGLSAALPDSVRLSFALGADPRTGKLAPAAAPQWHRHAGDLPRRRGRDPSRDGPGDRCWPLDGDACRCRSRGPRLRRDLRHAHRRGQWHPPARDPRDRSVRPASIGPGALRRQHRGRFRRLRDHLPGAAGAPDPGGACRRSAS